MVKLAEMHYKESQLFRRGQSFNPKFERYNQYAQMGCFIQFTVRDEGRMVGYGGVYLVPSMHTQELTAMEDTWFLLPEYRKGWNAMKFFKFMEKVVKERGAKEVTLTVPAGIGTGILCERMGYNRIAEMYNKQLLKLQDEEA